MMSLESKDEIHRVIALNPFLLYDVYDHVQSCAESSYATGWPISHATEVKVEYLSQRSSK